MTLRRQGGQALVETALAAPLLILLVLGLFQLGQVLWLRVKLQAAAQAAARAYTVYQPVDSPLALKKAQAAAWLALRPQPRDSRVRVSVVDGPAFHAFESDMHRTWLLGRLAHRLLVVLWMPSPPGLRWLWPQGLSLEAPVSILSEESSERHAADH